MQRHSWVFSLAVVIGMGAFLWTLMTYQGPTRPPARPSSPRVSNPAINQAWRAYQRGEMAESLERWRIGLETEPTEARYWYWAAWAADGAGDEAFAHRAWGEALARYIGEMGEGNQVRVWTRVGWCRSKLGFDDGGVEAWDTALALFNESMEQTGGLPDSWYRLACCRALVGDREGALAALEKAADEQSFDGSWALMDPDLGSIRDEPRAKAAIQKMIDSGIQIRGG